MQVQGSTLNSTPELITKGESLRDYSQVSIGKVGANLINVVDGLRTNGITALGMSLLLF